MDAKEFLMQAVRIARDIEAHCAELDRLRALAEICGAISYDQDRVVKSLPQSARFEGKVIRLVDVISECRQEIDELVAVHSGIRDVIALVEDEEVQAALRFRYLAGMEVDMISKRMKMSGSTVKRRLAEGEDQVARILDMPQPPRQRMPARERHHESRKILREFFEKK